MFSFIQLNVMWSSNSNMVDNEKSHFIYHYWSMYTEKRDINVWWNEYNETDFL